MAAGGAKRDKKKKNYAHSTITNDFLSCRKDKIMLYLYSLGYNYNQTILKRRYICTCKRMFWKLIR